jgi:hypothetical protein
VCIATTMPLVWSCSSKPSRRSNLLGSIKARVATLATLSSHPLSEAARRQLLPGGGARGGPLRPGVLAASRVPARVATRPLTPAPPTPPAPTPTPCASWQRRSWRCGSGPSCSDPVSSRASTPCSSATSCTGRGSSRASSRPSAWSVHR